MEALFARYFDGELGDREAREFLDAVELNPGLEKELRAYERMLAIGRSLPNVAAPGVFTERVMANLPAASSRARGRSWFSLPRLNWATAVATVSAVLLAYAGGWWSARERSGSADLSAATQSPSVELLPASAGGTVPGSSLRYVRLVYVPGDSEIEQVSVAGSFNNWQPNATVMQRQNGVWSTILVLPPGSYEYMFVEDGRRWITDPLAMETRDDGFGNANAVLDL